MKRVITYGSFDLFHEGHYRLLERAKALGDYLIVGVTTEQYDEYRGKLNIVDSLMDRINHIKQTGFADEIIIEDHVGQKVDDIQKYNVDIFTVGSDWLGCFDYIKDYCEVVYLERTKGVSSTMLRAKNFKLINLGVIGSGRIAARFIPEAKYVSGINVEAVYNPNLESAKRFAVEFQLNFYTNDLQAFFDRVDAVYIASTHKTHYEYIKAALNNGKHVICEKPMVIEKKQAIEMYALAKEKDLVLIEAIKTAYAPGFTKLLSMSKSGEIGKICDVEACFTKLMSGDIREFDPNEYGGSFTELASYPLLTIIKLLGTDFRTVRFESFVNSEGIDMYTKAYIEYDTYVATAKVGLGVKSEGQMIVSGTKGYILVEAPWWKTTQFEIRYENSNADEKFYTRFLGEGLRYEISDFVSQINGNNKNCFKLKPEESVAIIDIMERFITGKDCMKISKKVF